MTQMMQFFLISNYIAYLTTFWV